MSRPDVTHVEIDAVNAVLRTPTLSIGANVAEFERLVRSVAGSTQAVAVSSGTAALHLCMRAALDDLVSKGRWREDTDVSALVLTTPFSFIASANSILFERATPIFIDVSPETGNLEPSLVAEAVRDLTEGGAKAMKWLPPSVQNRPASRTVLAGLLPVHVFGQPCDIDPMIATASSYDIPCIEDACEAIGAEYKGRSVGALGTAGTFAFYPNKQVTTGEGGIVVTNREDWGSLFRSLRNQGRDEHDSWLSHSRIGYNYRLDEMSAALGTAQLGRLEELLRRRETVAGWYTQRLRGHSQLNVPTIAATTTRMSWFVYVVMLAKEVNRRELMNQLEQCGIPTRPYFAPIHLQRPYVERFNYRPGQFPVAEHLGESCLALPFSGVMTQDSVDYVCENLVRLLESWT